MTFRMDPSRRGLPIVVDVGRVDDDGNVGCEVGGRWRSKGSSDTGLSSGKEGRKHLRKSGLWW